jgi:hypothetical protein
MVPNLSNNLSEIKPYWWTGDRSNPGGGLETGRTLVVDWGQQEADNSFNSSRRKNLRKSY